MGPASVVIFAEVCQAAPNNGAKETLSRFLLLLGQEYGMIDLHELQTTHLEVKMCEPTSIMFGELYSWRKRGLNQNGSFERRTNWRHKLEAECFMFIIFGGKQGGS